MKKRFLSILTALALCLTLLPGTALAAEPTEASTECPFTIAKTEGGNVESTDYTWDATNSVLTINTTDALTISMAAGQTTPATATIVAAAGQAGGTQIDLDLTLAGVNITGVSSNPALSTNGDLAITLQGDNTLTGGNSGGNGIYAGTLTINGPGTLQAQGTSSQHGIQIKRSVTITGGTVTATGGNSDGAGISFDGDASDKKVIISGGNVTANGGGNGKGIGGQAATFSTGDNGTAIIHVSSFGNSITKASQLSGIIFEGNAGKVYGNQTLEEDLTIKNGETLTIPSGAKLTVPEGKTLTNNGTLTVEGTLAGEGAINPKLTNTLTSDDFTYTAPADLTYNGQAKTATVTAKNTTGLGEVTVKYQTGSSEATTAAPTEVGTYKVLVSVAEGNMYAATATDIEVGSFTITSAAPTTYTVTYNGNGATSGTAPVDSSSPYTSGTSVTVLGAGSLEKSGHTFAGWNTAADGTGTSYAAGATFAITANTTLYAQWTAETPSNTPVTGVTLDKSALALTVGGSETLTAAVAPDNATNKAVTWTTSDESVATVDGNGLVTAVSAGKATITVTTADGGFTDTCEVTVEKVEVLPETYTVAFDANGGAVSPATMETGTDGKLASLPTPARTGYTFDGWFTAATGGEKITTATVFTGDTTVYARWTEIEKPVDPEPERPVRPSEPSYRPEVEEPQGGQVELDHKRPEKGDTVTITPRPDQGKEVADIIVTDKNGRPVEVVDNGDGTFSFRQPAGKVTIEVTFADKAPAPLPFVDVAPGAWYEGAVRFVYEEGVMEGTGPVTFSPGLPTSRATVVTTLWRMAGSPDPESAVAYPDVAGDAWYADAVRWASGEGLVTGYDDGLFRPDAPVTREELAVLLWRYAGSPMLMDYEGLDQFTDVADLSLWAQQAMVWANAEGIVTGYGRLLLPRGHATRAETAAMLRRLVENW